MEKKQEKESPAKPPAKEKEASPRPQPKVEKPRHIKITQMSLHEIEKALEDTNQHMGGFHSQYARALLVRKEYLSQHSSSDVRKAA